MAGPFHGLSAQNNNVRALNSDSMRLADSSSVLFGLDKEVYLAILLQNAADPKLRFNPTSGQTPSQFRASVNPNEQGPGLNTIVLPPTYPHATRLSPDGTYTSSPGLSAWQNTLVPPPGPEATPEQRTLGRAVFERAGCAAYHAGPFLTNNQVLPLARVGTEPVRAAAMTKAAAHRVPAVIFGFNTPVPIPENAERVEVPPGSFNQDQLRNPWAD